MNRVLATVMTLMSAVMLKAQEPDTLRLSSLFTTHIVFRNELEYVDISNKALAGKVLEQSSNVLALKARAPFDYETTVTALENDGTIHTYIVIYDESPKELVLDYRKAFRASEISGNQLQSGLAGPDSVDISGRRQKLFHIADRHYGISVICEDVFIKDDRTWFILSLKNKSGINYRCSDAGFVVESRKKTKRSVEFGKTLSPVKILGNLSADAGSSSKMVCLLDKVTLADDQVLRIYIYEDGGSRNLNLSLIPKDVNGARGDRL